ncbi:MAG: DPP IV N-terminal domain-containing protein [Bacteroidia bacterium]
MHWSERDGWGHLYLYDDQGNVKNQITKGPWHINRVEEVDEKNRVVYFTANGREKEKILIIHTFIVSNLTDLGLLCLIREIMTIVLL